MFVLSLHFVLSPLFFFFYIFRAVDIVEQHDVSFLHEYDLRWIIGVLVLRYDKRFLICSLSDLIYFSWVLNVHRRNNLVQWFYNS